MKRILSIIIAAIMIFAMLPASVLAAEADVERYEYVFTNTSLGKTSSFDWANNTSTVAGIETSPWTAVYKRNGYSCNFTADRLLFSYDRSTSYNHNLKNGTLFKIRVGKTADYTSALWHYTYKYGAKVNVYVFENMGEYAEWYKYMNAIADGTVKDGYTLLGSANCYKEGDTSVEGTKVETPLANIRLEKDKDYYLFITMDGENSQRVEDVSGTTDNYFYFSVYSFVLEEIPTLTVTEDISFVATSNVATEDMMNVEADGFTYETFTDSIPVGTSVKVTAPEKLGYEFKHWVRGSADNGVYISDDPEYTFTALTNTFLTAIYENVSNEADATATVEFYNGNGQYLDKAVSTVGGTVAIPDNAKAPKMTGFEFANQWKTEDGIFDANTPLTRKLTRAVAQFSTPSTTFTVTCGDKEIPLTYGSEHTFTSNNPVYWMRDNTVVDYGTSYTHAAWDATEITTSETGELVPVVLLDADAKDGARMIEYNAAGKNVLEVGIVFGSGDVSIKSCNSKATSQYKNQHGQFTAKPYNSTDAAAKGYLIYEEYGVYKVVYSK